MLGLVCDTDDTYTGRMLIDDVYLRERQGFTDKDFVQYRCDPDVEPARLLAGHTESDFSIRRGAVEELDTDMKKDAVKSKL